MREPASRPQRITKLGALSDVEDPRPPDVPGLRKLFKSKGINSSRPGFYDDPGFKSLEAETPTALEWYFPFVELAGRDVAYVERARGIIENAAAFLHERLVADGRKGACIDASAARPGPASPEFEPTALPPSPQ